MKIEEEGIESFNLELTNLHFIQSGLCLKINELKALRHSIKDALAQCEASQEDYTILQAELENLIVLRKELEASRKAFHAKVGAKHPREAVKAYKTVDENINAALNIQVNVEMLIRKVGKQLAGEGIKSSEGEMKNTQSEAIKEKANNEEEESEDEQDDENISKSAESDSSYNAEEKTRRVMSLRLKVPLCLALVVTFYFCLGAVIQFVQNNTMNNKNGMST